MKDPKTPLSRRHVFAGAGTLGALAAAATVLPGVTKPDATPAPVSAVQRADGGRAGCNADNSCCTAACDIPCALCFVHARNAGKPRRKLVRPGAHRWVRAT